MTRARQLYAIPVLGRYGLTHGILAWARCHVWCRENNAQMLAPFWFKVRVGPYLRRERDKRNYFLLFHSGTAVGGLTRLATLARVRKVDIGPEWPELPSGDDPVVLRFHNALRDNERKSFAQVLGHGPFLRQEMVAMTHRRYHPAPANRQFIAIHVRLGDFTKVDAEPSALAGLNNTRLPIEWYGDRLSALRLALGREVPATVFSDGSDDDLAMLLSLPGVARAPKQASVTDLLAMGQGVALIASGSGFSRWGAFLGSIPRVSFPGQAGVPIDSDLTRDIESGFAEAFPASFVEHVRVQLDK